MRKTEIVFGAASGIGRDIALVFGREGAKVAIADLNKDAAETVAEEIGSSPLSLARGIRLPTPPGFSFAYLCALSCFHALVPASEGTDTDEGDLKYVISPRVSILTSQVVCANRLISSRFVA
jgi:NAD(P)-dependent dehydrogenase (short-subunit alcohol dehydrogenase family)